jgi:UDP-N-acetylmuramoyl-tripeptide--D-alanyl-D-alanine ligase
MELTAADIARVTGGSVAAGDPSARAASWTVDSRAVEPGACFVALRGGSDGHSYLADALVRGATVVVVDRDAGIDPVAGQAVVRVADSLRALGALGADARDRHHGGIVVGITGSVGKTTTRDLTAAALSAKYRVHASPSNFNNEAGLPLTLLAAPAGADALVLEMGARTAGNIAELAAMARPTIGVITNIGLAHAGPMGGREGAERVKGELLEALGPEHLAVLDANDRATPRLAARTVARVLTISVSASSGDVGVRDVVVDAELRASFRLETPWGTAVARLALRGAHNVANAALAATVALAEGVPLDDVVGQLGTVEAAPWRMQLLQSVRSGLTIVNDAYNASPASTIAAVEALAALSVPGRRVAVLGEMRELGPYSDQEHARVGRLVATHPIDVVVVVGPEARPLAVAARGASTGRVEVVEVPDAAAALVVLESRVGPGDAVLVKGSRAVGLEHVAAALESRRGAGEDEQP